MITNAFGELVRSEVVCTEEQRAWFIEAHRKLLKNPNCVLRMPKRLGKLNVPTPRPEQIQRLLKLHQDFEAEERRKTEIPSVGVAAGQSKHDIGDSGCLKEVDKVTVFSATDNLLQFNALSITSDKITNIKSQPPTYPL